LADILLEPKTTKQDSRINELVGRVKKALPKRLTPRVEIARVIRGGSLHKNTAMHERFDCDLVFVLRMDLAEFVQDRMQASLKKALLDALDFQDVAIDPSSYTNPYPSVKCVFGGISFDVLVGASRIGGKGGKSEWSQRQLNDVQAFVLEKGYMRGCRAARRLSASTSESAVRFVFDETDTVKKTVVLLKQWRDHFQLKRQKSFVLELVAVCAAFQLRGQASKKGHTCLQLFRQCMKLLDLSAVDCDDPRILDCQHLDLYDVYEWDEMIFDPEKAPAHVRRQRLHLLNPMTPNLDVLFGVPAKVLDTWSDAAEQTLRTLSSKSSSVEDIFGTSP